MLAYFFLSYASADDDGYLRRFFADLRGELRRRIGGNLEDAGFRDIANLSLGSLWSTGLTEAIASCNIFIALCSPSYFASDSCGREWGVFTHRLELHKARAGWVAPLIIPLIWVPARSHPYVSRAIQYRHEDLGRVYAAEGLLYLLRIRRHHDDYQEFLTRLTEKMISAVERHPLLPMAAPADLAAFTNAFVEDDPATGSVEDAQRRAGPDEIPARGPRHIHFVIAAGSNGEMAQVRGSLEYYGELPQDWSPYRPRFSRRISSFAQHVVSNQDFTSAVVAARASVADLLDTAGRENELVVFVVDPWAARVDPYARVLVEYDRRNEPTTAVLLPANEDDAETMRYSADLHRSLWRVFRNSLVRGDQLLRVAIPTAEAFERQLLDALAEAQNRLFRSGAVNRRAGGEALIERPVLGAAGGGDAQL